MKKLLLLCFLPLAASSVALTSNTVRAEVAAAASGPSWELTGSTNAYLLVTHQSDDGGDPFEANLGTHLNYFVMPQWEVGGRIGFTTITGGNYGETRTSFTLTVGPTFNLSNDPANSFFATAQAGFGIYHFGNSGNTYAPFSFLVGIGRRVGIVEHVTWTPEFTFSGRVRAANGTSYLTGLTNYELRLFQFSVLL